MTTTIWTSDDIATLKAAVVSGTLTVSYSGPPSRTVTYQSLQVMMDLLKWVTASVADAAGTRKSHRFVSTSKGFLPPKDGT